MLHIYPSCTQYKDQHFLFGKKILNYLPALNLENKQLSRLLTNYQGRHLLLLSNHVLSSLACSPIQHKIRISQTPISAADSTMDCTFLQSNYFNLPFASDSINLVILHHSLESDENAKHILSEAWRVLTPNGHLILLGVNPTSLWGLNKILSSNNTPYFNKYSPTITTVCRWIHLLSGEICHIESFFFRPPLTSRFGTWLFERLFWLEQVSPWLFPYLGGIYLIIAQKYELRLHRLRIAWPFPPILANKTLTSNAHGAHRCLQRIK